MRITDLMDDYYDENISLPEAKTPTAERTRELTMQKLGMTAQKRRRVPLGVLIAAACVLALSITAGAVGYSLWDAARADVGLEASAEIPEYREYQAEGSNQAEMSRPEALPGNNVNYVDGAKVELISTLCAGEDVTAYVTISPVSQEMADKSWEEAHELDIFTAWEATVDPETMDVGEGYSAGAYQVEYDPETETALLRLEFHGKSFVQSEGFAVGMDWFYQAGDDYETRYYGAVRIPVTLSEEVVFHPDQTFENLFLSGETATLTEVSLGASYVSLTYQLPSFDAICDAYGQSACFIIGDAYEGYYAELSGEPRKTEYTELDALAYYGRSWSASLDRLMETAYVTLEDGTEISLNDLQGTDSTMLENGDTTRTQTFQLSGALDISQIASVTVGGQTYTK